MHYDPLSSISNITLRTVDFRGILAAVARYQIILQGLLTRCYS